MMAANRVELSALSDGKREQIPASAESFGTHPGY